MAFWSGQPVYKSKGSSKYIRESLAWLKEQVDDLLAWQEDLDPYPILGDSQVRIMRVSSVLISNAVTGTSVSCSITGQYNGQNVIEQTVAKGTTVGAYTLNADGSLLTVDSANFGASGVHVSLYGRIHYNLTGLSILVNVHELSPGNLVLRFRNPTSGAIVDITSMGIGTYIAVEIAYLTSE
jgi:hypothetical protein